MLHDRGDLDGAEEYYRALVEENVLALGEHHKTTAIYRGNLAALLMDRGQFDEATVLLEAAIATYRDGAKAGSHLVIALRNLSVCSTRSGQCAEALARGREALELALPVYGEGSSMHEAALRALRANELEAAFQVMVARFCPVDSSANRLQRSLANPLVVIGVASKGAVVRHQTDPRSRRSGNWIGCCSPSPAGRLWTVPKCCFSVRFHP